MGKLIKIIAALVILLVIAAVAIPLLIDPNDYRDEIVAAVEENTGRKLQIDGELGLSVFPWVGVDIGELSLGNAAGFGEKPFAAIKEATIRIKLLPLLSKEIVADTIILDGLQLNLAKNKAGVSNWDDLAGGESKKETAEQTDTKEGSAPGLGSLAIGGISINNATIDWQDESTGQSYQLTQFNLNSGAIAPGDPVDLSLGLQLSSTQPAMTADVKLEGTVEVDADITNVSVTPLTASVKASGDSFPKGKLEADLSSNIAVNLKELAVKLTGLSLNSGELKLTGDVSATNLAAAPAIDGNIKLTRINLKQWLGSLGIELPAMQNKEALTAFDADIAMQSSGTTTKLTRLNINLDKTVINGTAVMAGSHIGFDLKIDQVNVDDYLPPSTDNKEQSPAAGSGETASNGDAELFPVEMLRSLDLDGKVAIGKLVASKLTSEQVSAQIKAKNGLINVTQKVGRFYEGSFDGKTNLNVSGKTPKLAVTADLENLQAGPLLKDLTGKDTLTGAGRFDLDINATGNSVNAIKKTLNGNTSFRFDEGAVKGVNLAKLLRETKARFEGKTLPPSNEPEQTDFSELSGSAKITNGVINNQDLSAKSPFLRVNGAGKVNLPAETLDYTAEATIVTTSKGSGGEELKDLEGLNIPVKLTGSYLAPNYQVDWGKVLLSSQKAKVNEKIEEKKQDLQKKLQDKLGDKLKGFF